MSIQKSEPPVDLLPATPLSHHVAETLRIYFHNLGGQAPSNLYDLVLREVEPPLLDIVMKFTHGNQTRAAIILGLNRGTLRKKLRQYGLAEPAQEEHCSADRGLLKT